MRNDVAAELINVDAECNLSLDSPRRPTMPFSLQSGPRLILGLIRPGDSLLMMRFVRAEAILVVANHHPSLGGVRLSTVDGGLRRTQGTRRSPEPRSIDPSNFIL